MEQKCPLSPRIGALRARLFAESNGDPKGVIWSKTAIYRRAQPSITTARQTDYFHDDAFICEECSDPDEAQRLADWYQRIIANIERQVDEQGAGSGKLGAGGQRTEWELRNSDCELRIGKAGSGKLGARSKGAEGLERRHRGCYSYGPVMK